MKRLFALILAFAMALSLAACAGAAAETQSETEAVPESTAAVKTAAVSRYPITVTDQAGREVTIEAEPQRIVSGYYISSSLLMALGQADKLVGIEAKADKRAIYALSAPELMELPSVGSAKDFDLEGCAALDPDLVILPMKLKEAAKALEKLGIPAILVNPENQELLQEANDLLGTVLNCSEAAQALDDFMMTTQAELTAITALAEEGPGVYMAGNSRFLSTAGGKMYQNSLIELAGGRNVAGELEDSYWAEVSYEQLLAWDPDYIILAADASYSVEDVLEDPDLAGITAVEEGRVYRMPNAAEAWDSPVPGGILGAVWMASRFHSDLLPEEACNKIVGDFYETFYGFDYGNA